METVIEYPKWWKRRTGLERKLFILISILVLLLITLATLTAILVVRENTRSKNSAGNSEFDTGMPETVPSDIFRRARYNSTKKDHEDEVCLSQSCIHSASQLLQIMNPTVDPCDDFYEFSCGQFLETLVTPDNIESSSIADALSEKLLRELKSLLEEPIQPNEPHPFVLAKNLYKACMNTTTINKRGHQPLLNLLQKLGGWPVLEGKNWEDEKFDWRETIYRSREIGFPIEYFVDISVEENLKNSTIRNIKLDQPSLDLSREYLTKGFDEEIVQVYYEYQVDIAVLLGADRELAEKDLKESLLFEMELSNISLPNELRRNSSKLFNPMTVSELQEKFPSIPWLEYFNRLLPSHIQINKDEIIIVEVPSFIKQLEVLLSRTPKRVLANYMMWRAAAASVDYLSEDLRNRQLQYSSGILGEQEKNSRWRECSYVVSSQIFFVIDSMYVKKYVKKEVKRDVLEIVTNIREEFIKILKNLDWMDEATRSQALEKAAAMVTHIAYPDELLDVSKLEKFYGTFSIDPEYFLESVLNLTTFGTDYAFGKLRQPVNKTEWTRHSTASLVNAFYSGTENSIQFPAGILQGIFFSNDRPKYMNYGAIGATIGHEITHGFDDQGRQFDKNGNLVDWWAKETEKKFLNRTHCIIEQYGNYTAEEVGLKLNGINTQGENIADNGGIKVAYRAYTHWAKRNKKEPRLPGLPYTPNQLFWISAASTSCEFYEPEDLKIRIITGTHPPARFRIIGPFSNMPEFAKDFNCPLGSKMNPVHKCTVW